MLNPLEVSNHRIRANREDAASGTRVALAHPSVYHWLQEAPFSRFGGGSKQARRDIHQAAETAASQPEGQGLEKWTPGPELGSAAQKAR